MGRRSPCALLSLGLVAACHLRADVSRPSDEVAASIRRVEHGLIDEIRVAGDPPGWTIDERLRAHNTPAISVAVIHDYRIVWARAYGARELGSGTRADAQTLFQAASISKMVTALAALQQADEGRVALDANINQALRSWKLPDNELTRATPVTLRQLLSHTAGVNLHSVDGYPEGATLPTLHQILDGLPPATNAAVRVVEPPGRAFAYSGGGLLVVQQLVEDLAGRPFAQAMERAVFAPFGMSASTFELPMPARFANRAVAYDTDETALPPLVNPESAPAGLWATPTDLARFLIEVQLASEGRSRKVSKRVADWMVTPVTPTGPPDVAIGLGPFVEKHGATTYFGHDGWNDGFLSMSRAMLHRGDGAVVMTNGAAGAPVIFEMMRAIAVEYRWDGWLPEVIAPAHLSSARLASLVGRYRAGGVTAADGSLRIAVAASGDRLTGFQPLRAPLELIPVSDDTFINRADGAHFVFGRGDDGLSQIVETLKGDRDVLAQIPDDTAEPSALLDGGRYDEALAAYRTALLAHPKDPTLSEAYLDGLGRDLLSLRFDVPRAVTVFRIDAALYPRSANANAALAFAYLRAGRVADGAPFYLAALALQGHDGTHTEMETVYLNWRLHRFKAALKT